MLQQCIMMAAMVFGWFSAQAQMDLTDSLLHQNHQRQFMVHFPPGFSNSANLPLVVNLHGGSGNMVNAQGFSQLNPVADQHQFVVAWPQGFGIAPPGYSWADGRNTSADQAGIDDVGFLNRLVDTLIQRYNLDSNRIYLCGFSNGGFMVQRMACQSPGRFAAMASLGASMDTNLYQQCNPAVAIPMAFFNGTADPAMPFLGGPMQNPQVTPVVPVDSAVQFWVQHNQCQTPLAPTFFPDVFPTDNSTAELYAFEQCHCNSSVRFYKLINGGHTWPGVYVPSQAALLGNTNRDIHASDELWDFFSPLSRCSTPLTLHSTPPTGHLKIYPNPAQDILSIETSFIQPLELTLLNAQGAILFKGPFSPSMDISDLPTGLYFLRVQFNDFVQTHRWIKN